MAKKRKAPKPAGDADRSAVDYYRLKTEAVEDLVGATVENSPQVSREELERYGARKKRGVKSWLKVCLVKFWFPGSVFFFMVMGLGLWDTLDQVVILGVVLGMVTDLLTNNILRLFAETDGANDGWMMFPRKGYATFPLNIVYAMVLCAMVLGVYAGVDAIGNAAGGTQGVKYLMGEPVTFGLFYLMCDLALVGIKHLITAAVGRAKSKSV